MRTDGQTDRQTERWTDRLTTRYNISRRGAFRSDLMLLPLTLKFPKSSLTVPHIFVRLEPKLDFLDRFSYFHGNTFSGGCADTRGQTDKRTDMTKVIGAFRDYTKATNNVFHYCNIVVNTYVNLRRKRPKTSGKLINFDSHS